MCTRAGVHVITHNGVIKIELSVYNCIVTSSRQGGDSDTLGNIWKRSEIRALGVTRLTGRIDRRSTMVCDRRWWAHVEGSVELPCVIQVVAYKKDWSRPLALTAMLCP